MRLRPIWFGIAFAAVLCAGASAAAQDPKEPTSNVKTPGKGDTVVVKGCLVGPTLESVETVTTDETGHASGPITYQLRGDKKVLKRMRDEHDGKVVEVTGILKSALPQDSSIRGKTMGKTKVTFGIGTPSAQKGAPDLQSSLPVLEVKSYDGFGTPCGR
jgi:hypothetical protein